MKTRKRARRTALLTLIAALLALLFWTESGFDPVFPAARLRRVARQYMVSELEILGRGGGNELVSLADGEMMVMGDNNYVVVFAETKNGCALFPSITSAFEDELLFTGWCGNSTARSADMSVHISHTGLWEGDYTASCSSLEKGLACFEVERKTDGVVSPYGNWMPEQLAFWDIQGASFSYGGENWSLSCSIRFYNADGETVAEAEFEY